MKFRCKYEAEDYVTGYKAYARLGSRKWTTRLLWAMAIIGTSIGILGSMAPKASIGPAVPLFLISGYLVYSASTIWARAGRRAFSKRPELAQEFDVDISDVGIIFEGPISGTRWTWQAFIKFAETKQLFLTYLSPCAFVILPKRLLGSDQVDALRVTLQKKLPGN